MPISEKINNVLEQVSDGKEPIAELTQIINALVKYQKNLKKLLGYETDMKLETLHPFPEVKRKS